MFNLRAALCLFIAPTLSGIFVLFGVLLPELGLFDFPGLLLLAAIGLALGVPASALVARRIRSQEAKSVSRACPVHMRSPSAR